MIFLQLFLTVYVVTFSYSLQADDDLDLLSVLENELSEDDRLYLTPYIESNRLAEGRKLAQVTGLGWNVTSYSGLLTVNKEYGSNMFFWYFPSERNPTKVPLLIWLNGFSTASTYGIFLQNGPYSLYNEKEPTPREFSWQKYFHVVYIDNPVGVGFSFTNSKDGYTTNLNSTSLNLHTAVQQFLQLFPDLATRELYITGLSLGGKYVSSLAYRIHNQKSFNLKGIFLGNPLLNPGIQFNFHDYLYEMGLVDKKESNAISQYEQKLLSYFKEQNYPKYYQEFQTFLLSDDSYLTNVTGLYSIYNYENPYIVTDNYDRFITSPNLKNAVHVGATPFNNGTYAMSLFAEGFGFPVTGWLETMLDDVKMLFYAGQLDVVCAYPMLVDALSSMNWTGKEGYANADRVKLRDDGDAYVWGYLKNYKTLTDVLVRKADHSAVTEQPGHVFELLLNFTDYNSFRN